MNPIHLIVDERVPRRWQAPWITLQAAVIVGSVEVGAQQFTPVDAPVTTQMTVLALFGLLGGSLLQASFSAIRLLRQSPDGCPAGGLNCNDRGDGYCSKCGNRV